MNESIKCFLWNQKLQVDIQWNLKCWFVSFSTNRKRFQFRYFERSKAEAVSAENHSYLSKYLSFRFPLMMLVFIFEPLIITCFAGAQSLEISLNFPSAMFVPPTCLGFHTRSRSLKSPRKTSNRRSKGNWKHLLITQNEERLTRGSVIII